ncbi:MAG: hypothetical protein M3433_01925 [Actinomycetota bacterium]|nr:hypothetical protein [Actinomycetota bacterium]MDQ3647343.1 hypothetical protein [Actinomycetota bacterium]
MSEAVNLAYQAIDTDHAGESAATRRKFVAGAGATLGGMGLLGLTAGAEDAMAKNDAKTILNVAATAEVLATIVNTVGAERVPLDPVTKRNVQAAAREELIHYKFLRKFGAKPATKRIWVPNAVFADKAGLLNTLVTGDQIFINAYLIGTTAFAKARSTKFARFTAETMGAEAVHRALALQSLGKLGNDRVFMRYSFTRIETAVKLLKKAGFGFGEEGAKPGAFYEFNSVNKRTPDPAGVNTRRPR